MPVDPRPGDARGRRGTTRDERRRRLLAEFDALAEEDEAAYRRAALRLFAGERESIAAFWTQLVERSGGRLRENDPIARAAIRFIERSYAPNGLYHRKWVASYANLIGETMSVGGKNIGASVGFSFSLSNPQVARAVERRASDLATVIGETSGARVSTVIRDSVTNGVPIARVATRIRNEAFSGEITRARAVNIARTETISALGKGEYVSAQASGVLETVEWMTQNDERVRDSHAAQNGVKIKLGERFPNGQLHPGDMDGIPIEEFAQCRCTALYSA